MKIIFWFLILCLPPWAHAQSFSQFLSSAAATAEMDSAFNLEGGKFAAAYVPLRTINIKTVGIADVGGGGVFGAGTPQGLAAVRLNIPQLINLLFGTKWFTSNTTGPTLPNLFLGPSLKMEWPITNWTWKKDTFLLIGLPVSALP